MHLRWITFPQLCQPSRPLRPDCLVQSIRARPQFHSSASCLAIVADEQSHYDILNLPHTATGGEIKRRYYELSKVHHPDHNPNDPAAATRFSRLSDAYAVIGNAKKRERYDKELAHRHGIRHHRAAGPAGGRPASGLSRRRTQFHGPPPSFFRSGGWVNKGGTASSRQGSAAAASRMGGFGIGGVQSGRNDDVPHFDFERHRLQQERRRRPSNQARFEIAATSTILPLIGVTSLLMVAVAIASKEAKAVDMAKRNKDT
ncbi:hypothetical protein BDZ91DRAFT_711939 [Kalaharituber pfeilii]|nr:hypothetical protein BDZ91DRAFT_711939 [Kalaharituber pfeilii]